jgi:23S rRNA pseudoU1915 N3-methylase RlmH
MRKTNVMCVGALVARKNNAGITNATKTFEENKRVTQEKIKAKADVKKKERQEKKRKKAEKNHKTKPPNKIAIRVECRTAASKNGTSRYVFCARCFTIL